MKLPTSEEDRIFREAYQYFRAHAAPPPSTDVEGAVEWWLEASAAVGQLAARWGNHPLMNGLLMAILEYLEAKTKEAQP